MSPDVVRRAEQLASVGRWQEVAAILEPVIENTQSAGLWSVLALALLKHRLTGRLPVHS